MDLKQAAARLGITPGAARNMVHRGQLPAVKERGIWTVDPEDVERATVRPVGAPYHEFRVGYRVDNISGTVDVTGKLKLRLTVMNLKNAGFRVAVYRNIRGQWVPSEVRR